MPSGKRARTAVGKSDLNIRLWVEGDGIPSRTSLSVKIRSTEPVSSLRERVFEAKRVYVPAKLRLWRLNDPIPPDDVNNAVHNLPATCWTLQLPQEVSDVFGLQIATVLIRDDYMEAFKQLFLRVKWDVPHLPDKLDPVDEFKNPLWERSEKMPRSNVKGFVLTGHPGIGKSTWLFLLLVLRLNAKLPTIYQIRMDVILFISAHGIETFNDPRELVKSLTIDSRNVVWALVDSDAALKTVDPEYFKRHAFVVQTPSPRADRLDWTSKCNCVFFFLCPWLLSELLCARTFQRTLCSESQLADFFEQYGPSPRLAYSKSVGLPHENENELRVALDNIPRDDLIRLLGSANVLNLDHKISHRIFAVCPEEIRSTATLQLLSPMVRDLLVENWKEKTRRTALDLYSVFVGNPFTKASARFLFEPITHDILPNGGVWELGMMMKRTSGMNVLVDSPNVGEPKSELRISADGFFIGSRATDATPPSITPIAFHLFSDDTMLTASGYYKPTSKKQATFDAFLYNAAKKHAAVIQVTVAEKHNVNAKDFEMLQKKGVQTFSYIAVTPTEMKTQLWFPKFEERQVAGWYQLELELPSV